ncbi:MAG TPA: ABC transporter substrate-binding protein [Streptosporangiaceae bacterium]
MRRPAAALAAALTLTLAAAACSSSGGKGNGSGSASGTPQHGGTVTQAWIGATPNFIFPYAPATNTDGYNTNLSDPLWPPLAFAGDGAQSAVNPQESLYSSLTFSNGNKTVTMVLKDWKWSDGAPITSRDFTFVYNLLKANYQNWINYIPGTFPSDVTSVSTPDTHTAVMTLSQPTSPEFFASVLNNVQLIPQHAWDKESATGPAGNYDQSAAGAKAVYDFLQKEGSQISTFTTNPLWKVVDGPWTLSDFNSDGTLYGYVPNKNYSGPHKPYLAKVENQSFTTDTAELDALRSGGSVQVAPLPLNDAAQAGQLKAQGYSTVPLPIPGVAGMEPNFFNAQVGAVFRQLYIRQAMEDLINRQQIVQKVYNGYADPGNGPVPVLAFPNWASSLEKSGGPYPYSPSSAISLLKAHGWKVVPGGVSTCQSPGTGPSQCGAGIAAGQQLQFQLAYSSGRATTDEQNAAIQSSEEQAGIKLNLKPTPFNTLAGTTGECTAKSHSQNCGWQIVEFGYNPYLLYPADTGNFATGGPSNLGGYSDPQTDSLITTTLQGSNVQTFFQYEDYVARQLPWLWLPLRENLVVYKSSLGGFAPTNPFSEDLDFELWHFSK